ncbi:MAG: heme ABC exporter ATP-binding protein CcmA [Gemmatimonadaceae bacterium]
MHQANLLGRRRRGLETRHITQRIAAGFRPARPRPYIVGAPPAHDLDSAFSSESSAVELTNIARRFGSRWVLTGVTVTLRIGETVAILGRNGTGKTTLLRIVATLLRPTRGSGTVFGHDLASDADAVRNRIGLLGHANAIYPDLTATENLGFTLRMLGRAVDTRAVEASLDAVALGSHANTRARGFSAGMQRRLALARLRLIAPDLLLLDEPYSSLDPEGTELVTSLVADTRRKGGATILVTHDIARATRDADRLLTLDDGRIGPWSPNRLRDGEVLDEPLPTESER